METSTNSLDRALALLEMIERTPGGLTGTEIRLRLHIPKSSYTYLMARLKKRGYLSQDHQSGRYKLGLNTLVLAYGTLREMGFRAVTEPLLYRLVSETGLAASIGVLARGRVLLVDRVENFEFARDAVDFANQSGPLTFTRRIRERRERDIGRELPVHSNALGKVLLAYLPREEALAIIAQQGLPRITAATIVSKTMLLADMDLTRERGHSSSNQEHYVGVRGIGAPIFDSNGAVCAALSVTGSPEKPVWSQDQRLLEIVKTTARSISRSMPA